jgi:hypothetical protein
LTTKINGYIVFLDPAKLHDFSALSVLKVTRDSHEVYNNYRLIALERQRRQPHEATAAWFVKAFKNPMLHRDVTFFPISLIDIGGVGEPTADIIKRMGVKVQGVRYTGSDGYRIEGRTVNVSKSLMVSSFLGTSEGGRFTMLGKASFEGLFKSELKDFRGEISKLGRMKFEAEEGSHDDLVMSVCQGVWFGETFIKPKHRSFKAPFKAVCFGNPDLETANSSLGPIVGLEGQPATWLDVRPGGIIRMTG